MYDVPMASSSARKAPAFYSKQQLLRLFLITALPIHLWTFFQFFADFSWIALVLDPWEAAAVGAYALLSALLESLFVAGCAAALGYLVSRKWDVETRVLLMGAFAVWTAIWAMAAQYGSHGLLAIPGWAAGSVWFASAPYETLTTLLGGLVAATLLPTAWLILRSERVRTILDTLVDRLNLLSLFYLAIDLAALVVLLVRNI